MQGMSGLSWASGQSSQGKNLWEPPAIPRRRPPTDLANTGLHSAAGKARAWGKMREDWVREGQPGGRATVRQRATAGECFQVLCECPRPQNSLLHSVGEILPALASGMGKVLEQESWVLIPAQFLTPVPPRPCHLPALVLSVLERAGRG